MIYGTRTYRSSRNQRIIQLARDGKSVPEIAEETQASRSIVYRVLALAEVEPVKKYRRG